MCSKLASYEVLQITTIKCTTTTQNIEERMRECRDQRESSKHVAWTILETSTNVGSLNENVPNTWPGKLLHTWVVSTRKFQTRGLDYS